MENNNERSHLEAVLKQVESELDEHEKKTLGMRAMRDYCRSKLGLPIEEKAKEASSVPIGVYTGTLPTFRNGDFYGLSQAEAVCKVLERTNGSLTIDELLKVLIDSGYSVGGGDQRRTLYSSICRSRKLVLVAKNSFDLAERRPQARKRKEKKTTGDASLFFSEEAVPKSEEEKTDKGLTGLE